ncbi:hypothetical protein OHR86_21405 [Streptomyces sp. NBC_00441]|uniref:hypothetical protein n=1 Tax=Streptomyces sp. NBC_00441 TaxID=2975742 RepID=UPI002E2B323E|nr:hypothetical protein [Streptomyces sp. NBC_00441]
MKRTRAVTTAAVMMAAGLLIGGCTSTPHDGTADDPAPAGSSERAADQAAAREPQACRGGTYTWFNMRQNWVINGVAEAQSVTGSGRVTKPVRRLRTDPASVVTEGADLDPDLVLHSLGTKLGLVSADDDPKGGSALGEPGTYAPLDEPLGQVSDVKGTVRLVSFSYFKLIETDFRHTCAGGGKPVIGHVSTWGPSGGGAVNCDEPLGKDASAAAHEAVKLSCAR